MTTFIKVFVITGLVVLVALTAYAVYTIFHHDRPEK